MENDEALLLADEDGNEYSFNLEMTIEYKNQTFCLLSPGEDEEDFEPGTVFVFRLKDDETLELVEDEELSEEVYNEYLSILDEQDTGEE
ncbi:MAG TPA: DUF1292 domain-containing protein [Clostridia bacterium]|nr:DUF1292 domain-containing protein [Clostridia bacterium]